jgi:hypothetical protein
MSGSEVFTIEHATGAVSLVQGDGLVIHVTNNSSQTEDVQLTIFENTATGASTVVGPHTQTLPPLFTGGLGFTASEGGEYWVRIQGSESTVPQVFFERLQQRTLTPWLVYKPGDFAVFDQQPVRRRRW